MKIWENLIGSYIIITETKNFPLFYFNDKEIEENKTFASIGRLTSRSGKKARFKFE